MEAFNFSETKSIAVAIRLSHVKSLEKHQAVVRYFQNLGFSDKQIQSSVRGCPGILLCDIDKNLKTKTEFFQLLGFADSRLDKDSKLLPNISYLESCGVVGAQLAMLLRRQPGLFIAQETALRNLVSKVLDMGFEMRSRMFVHGLIAVSCCSVERFERKVETFQSFGFSKDEIVEMARKAPFFINISTKKLII